MSIHYLIQTMLFQLIFLVAYDIFHKKDTFFILNRWYLIITPLLSLLFPFIKIETLNTRTSEIYITQIENIISLATVPQSITTLRVIEDAGSSINWWSICYYIGIGISFLLLILRLYKLHVLSNISLKTLVGKNKIIILSNSTQAFSFWNTIFLGDQFSEEEKTQIVSHELVHVNQRHSLDHLLFELLKIILWWNPLIYIYQFRITILHEYIADEIASNNLDKKAYLQQLLNTAFQTQKITFVNHFFNHSSIKKRILMLQKSKSQSIAKFKYLLLIPLITGILMYTSCEKETNPSTIKDISETKKPVSDDQPESICINTNPVHDESLDNYLNITTGSSAEVLISIVSIKTSEIIRRAHIKKNKTHRVQNIPEGIYRVDIIYGENYIEQEINGSCTGSFAKEVLSEIGEDTLDYTIEITDKGKNVPSYSLTVDLTDKQKNESSAIDNTISVNAIKPSFVAEKNKEEIPCANKSAIYDNSLDNYLKVTNGKNSEVIVKLINSETNKSIRLIHLKRNTTYSLKNIPEGLYYLTIAYGDDLEIKTEGDQCIPYFKTNPLYEKDENILDYTTNTSDQGFGVPSYNLTLDVLDFQKSK